jgi:hypothetical protein
MLPGDVHASVPWHTVATFWGTVAPSKVPIGSVSSLSKSEDGSAVDAPAAV